MIPRSNIENLVDNPADADWKMSVPLTLSRPRVWLVDDSVELRRLLASILAEEGGFDCEREFSSPREVLAALADGTPPDVILLDIQMGAECGLEAIRPIRSLAGSTHVIMLTTCFDRLRRTTARQNGATDFLLKSYSVEEIAARVRQALAQPVPEMEAVPVVPAACWEVPRLSHGQRFAGWRKAGSRILQGAFLLRSKLAMLF